jgi:hypothetical protein
MGVDGGGKHGRPLFERGPKGHKKFKKKSNIK